jgi:LacI family transcriptional regulator
MALAARGYAAVVANTDEDPDLQAQVVDAMIEHGVSAMILSPAYDSEASFAAISRAGLPAVQVLRRVVDSASCPFSAPDYAAGSRLAARHLLDAGARQIAFVGGLEGRAVTRDRMSGYLSVLADAGIAPVVISGRSTRAFGLDAAGRLARDHPDVDAAICFNDLVALGLLAGSARIGRGVGPGFRVVGFDDIEECAETYPGLSSVRCGISRLGKEIAGSVLDWLEGGAAPPAEALTPVELVVRESSR